MQWLKFALREIFALFIDDGRFALTILLWLGVLRLALPHLGAGRSWHGFVLFAGLALILAETAWRGARNHGG